MIPRQNKVESAGGRFLGNRNLAVLLDIGPKVRLSKSRIGFNLFGREPFV
jgi:hypothetical protein